jgi:hypothetical protein
VSRDAEVTGLGIMSPATMRPIRKATLAVRLRVTRVKRRDI